MTAMIYIISGSYLIERFPAACFLGLLVLGRRKSGDFFELLRKMLYATVAKHIGYFAQTQLIVFQ
jgi:hypothetical protein